MIPWKRIPYHIDIDPKKPGRTQNWFEMAALEKALGRPITWVYSNLIEPGKTAGSHYHHEHEVLVWVASGELVMHLRDVDSDEAETVTVKANSELLSVPRRVYHAGGNIGTEPCLAVMFASTKPRDAGDEYFT
ncbi:MAG TPA: cupin domain-containing protein [bacterium]|nr:cupin domain-containing protein [bacterium]